MAVGNSPRVPRAEQRMAALGIEPELVDVAVAAAVAAMPIDRFLARCPVTPVRDGQKRLVPLDDVRKWAKGWWARKAGQVPANDAGGGESIDAFPD